ncbi:unnamed protein product [Durusdinium trenchii]|uniref:Uncharacterized protein n=1 Tax=Durusdinium trenchii TaxID=1381693 RepID=A0ABP0I2Z8_9DINO
MTLGASGSFYETSSNGDRRPCGLKMSTSNSLADPKAKNCEADTKHACAKGKLLCQEELVVTETLATSPDSLNLSSPVSSNHKECNFCGGKFLPEATAFMEDGKPFRCQYALDEIRRGDSHFSCVEAAERLVDCCADTPAEPTETQWTGAPCELCAGHGELNGSAVAMILSGDPMNCSTAQQLLRTGRAPISCETAQSSELLGRCCASSGYSSSRNCSICAPGETFLPEATDPSGDRTCADARTALAASSGRCGAEELKETCCKCNLCDDGGLNGEELAM